MNENRSNQEKKKKDKESKVKGGEGGNYCQVEDGLKGKERMFPKERKKEHS